MPRYYFDLANGRRLADPSALVCRDDEDAKAKAEVIDRKSTRLNSSHGYISYAVFCLKKKKTTQRVDGQFHPSRRAASNHRSCHELRRMLGLRGLILFARYPKSRLLISIIPLRAYFL